MKSIERVSEQNKTAKWVIPNILSEGYTVLAGRPKNGKSRLAMGLSLAVASGGVFLGKFKVIQGEVLHLALEDNENRIQQRLKHFSEQGVSISDKLNFVSELPSDKEDIKEALQDWLLEHPKTKLIVIDTISHPIFSCPLSQGFDVENKGYNLGLWLQELAIKNNLCILGLLHKRKAQSECVFKKLSNLNGITASIDAVMSLAQASNGESTSILHITGRDIPEQELTLESNDSVWSLVD